MDDESGDRAVEDVPTLLLESKPVPLDSMSSYDHLKRVGLER
jgi:hypothetical protein